MSTTVYFGVANVDPIDTVEGVCNVFFALYTVFRVP